MCALRQSSQSATCQSRLNIQKSIYSVKISFNLAPGFSCILLHFPTIELLPSALIEILHD